MVLTCFALLASRAGAQSTQTLSPSAKATLFQAVPELPYRVVANFFQFPKGMVAGEAAGEHASARDHGVSWTLACIRLETTAGRAG